MSSQGLTFHLAWLSEEEGPFTALSKLAVANALSSLALRDLLLGVLAGPSASSVRTSPRNLLANFWMHEDLEQPGLADWDMISRGTLDAFLGHWSGKLASAERMRFCPSCIGQGYQSSICQIDAMQRCPAHGDLLVDHCLTCGAPTPPYTFEGATHHAQTCRHCDAACWGADVGDLFLKWRRMPGVEAYTALAMRLAPLQRASFMDHAAWDDAFRRRDPRAKRVATFNFLQRAIPLRLPESCFTREIEQVVLARARLSPAASSTASFKAARQCVEAYSDQHRLIRHSLGDESEVKRRLSEIRTHQLPDVIEPEDFQDPEALAYCLLRLRFEAFADFASIEGSLRVRSIRPQMLKLMKRFGPEAQECRRFVAFCYLVELSFCKLIRDQAAGFGRGHHRWHEVMDEHHRGFNAKDVLLPYGMALVRVRCATVSFAALGFAHARPLAPEGSTSTGASA